MRKKENCNKDSVLRFSQKLAGMMLDLIYPPRCPICDRILKQSDGLCCEECRRILPRITGPVCMKCGKPIAHPEAEYCPDCAGVQHFFERGTAPFTYSGALRRSVYRMKKENRRDYLDFYAQEMADACKRYLCYWRPNCILFVPMHKSAVRKRGFNQSQLLAERISRLLGIPTDCDAVRCVRRKTAQKSLGRRERLRNLRGTFAVTRQFPEGTRILIVDDVYTTGSTMDEMSRTLKAAGAEAVYFVVLCTGKGKKAVCTAENLCYTEE